MAPSDLHIPHCDGKMTMRFLFGPYAVEGKELSFAAGKKNGLVALAYREACGGITSFGGVTALTFYLARLDEIDDALHLKASAPKRPAFTLLRHEATSLASAPPCSSSGTTKNPGLPRMVFTRLIILASSAGGGITN